jgi:SOS-response transcriptional repressor LexA
MYKGRYYDIEIVKSVGDSVVVNSGIQYKWGKHVFVNLDDNDLVIKDYKEKKNRKN